MTEPFQLALPIVFVATSEGRPPCPGDPDGIHFYKFKQNLCAFCGLPFDASDPRSKRFFPADAKNEPALSAGRHCQNATEKSIGRKE